MSTHDQLIASVLNLRADFESLRNTEVLKIKTRGQELIIDRLKVPHPRRVQNKHK